MEHLGIFSKAIVAPICFLSAGLIVAQQAHFILEHGDYVQEPLACKDAPFAAIMSWNGIGFSDPHSSQCRSRVVTQSGNHGHILQEAATLADMHKLKPLLTEQDFGKDVAAAFEAVAKGSKGKVVLELF